MITVKVQKPQTVLRLGTVNVGALIGRSAEVVETLRRRNVDICVPQEVRFKKEGTKFVKGGEYEYKLYWMGEEVGQGGVAIMTKSELMQIVVEMKRVSPRIITMDIVIYEDIFTVIFVYCPQRGKSDEDKDAFYDELCDVVMSKKRKCFVMGDFNGHLRCLSNGYSGVHGGFGYGEKNREWENF